MITNNLKNIDTSSYIDLQKPSEKLSSVLFKVTWNALPIITSYLCDIDPAINSKFGTVLWLANTTLSSLGVYHLTSGMITALHETAHRIAIEGVYKDANPKIYFHWFEPGGMTTMKGRGTNLSWLGEKLGYHPCQVIYNAAGPFVHATALIGLALLTPSQSYIKIPILLHALELNSYFPSALFEKSEKVTVTMNQVEYEDLETANDFAKIYHHGGLKAYLTVSLYMVAALYFCFNSFMDTFSSELKIISTI